MFYRFTSDGRQKTCDLKDVYSGALVLCGGHPSLANEPLELLDRPGIVTMAMNNAALTVRPNLWVCADHATCYAKSILHDPATIKFARLLYWNDPLPGGEPWYHAPSTFFYGVSDTAFDSGNLLDDHFLFAWWKNVFIISLQLAYHLGFRTIYLAGAGFSVPDGRHYAFDHELTPEQSHYSLQTYGAVVDQVRKAMPHFEERGLSLISCTPDSALNAFLPFMPLRDAIDRIASAHPERSTAGLRHASDFVADAE
jgi:hypothetical protein